MKYLEKIIGHRWNVARKLSLLLTSLFLLTAFVFGCGSSSGSSTNGCKASNATATTSVTVSDFKFTPSCILVTAGQTVTWTNGTDPVHTVTSDSGAPVTFDSGPLGANGTFSFTFSSPETVGYHCIPHQAMGMVGTVVVQAAGNAASPSTGTGSGGGGTGGSGY